MALNLSPERVKQTNSQIVEYQSELNKYFQLQQASVSKAYDIYTDSAIRAKLHEINEKSRAIQEATKNNLQKISEFLTEQMNSYEKTQEEVSGNITSLLKALERVGTVLKNFGRM